MSSNIVLNSYENSSDPGPNGNIVIGAGLSALAPGTNNTLIITDGGMGIIFLIS